MKMMLAKFRQHYPQGSLVSELVKIDRGTYIVKASIEIEGIVIATGLSSAQQIETAEDNAKERALASLFLDYEPRANSQQLEPVKIKNTTITTPTKGATTGRSRGIQAVGTGESDGRLAESNDLLSQPQTKTKLESSLEPVIPTNSLQQSVAPATKETSASDDISLKIGESNSESVQNVNFSN
ncbi:MAG: hypothetical protein AAFY16_03990 [Cyanobacteria bacterium J06642_3]